MRIFFLLFLASGPSRLAVAATPQVAPGDIGTITFPVSHYDFAPAGTLMTSVVISTQGPSCFKVLGTSDLSAASIVRGATKTFVIDYEITSSSITGPFNVVLNVLASNSELLSLPNAAGMVRSATVQFYIDTSSPSALGLKNAHNDPLGSYINSTNSVRGGASDVGSGICWFNVSNGVFSSSVLRFSA